MKITSKGQVTIPQRLRLKFGLLPNTEVVFEEANGCLAVRPKVSKRVQIEERIRRVRGVSEGDPTADEVMRLTRGDE